MHCLSFHFKLKISVLPQSANLALACRPKSDSAFPNLGDIRAQLSQNCPIESLFQRTLGLRPQFWAKIYSVVSGSPIGFIVENERRDFLRSDHANPFKNHTQVSHFEFISQECQKP